MPAQYLELQEGNDGPSGYYYGSCGDGNGSLIYFKAKMDNLALTDSSLNFSLLEFSTDRVPISPSTKNLLPVTKGEAFECGDFGYSCGGEIMGNRMLLHKSRIFGDSAADMIYFEMIK
jgi:hypothetical protein